MSLLCSCNGLFDIIFNLKISSQFENCTDRIKLKNTIEEINGNYAGWEGREQDRGYKEGGTREVYKEGGTREGHKEGGTRCRTTTRVLNI